MWQRGNYWPDAALACCAEHIMVFVALLRSTSFFFFWFWLLAL